MSPLLNFSVANNVMEEIRIDFDKSMMSGAVSHDLANNGEKNLWLPQCRLHL